jgi:hypothetical protein
MCHTELHRTVGSPLPDTKEHGRPTSSSNELVHSDLAPEHDQRADCNHCLQLDLEWPHDWARRPWLKQPFRIADAIDPDLQPNPYQGGARRRRLDA